MIQIANNGNNCSLSTGLLTATGAVTTHDTTATINYVIDGVILQKTAITTGTTPTTDGVTGLAFPYLPGGNSVAGAYGNGVIVVWGIVGTTVTCIMGQIKALDVAGNFINAPEFPALPNTFAPFAYQVLKSKATAGLTVLFGTSNWNATGYTNVIKNVMVLPARPQIA